VPLETEDTRRARRLAARCGLTVVFGAGRWEGETEDLGPLGCRIVSLMPLRRGEAIRLRLRFPGVRFPLDVAGTVAWAATVPPYHTGVAFARGQEADVQRFVAAVLAARPGLARASADGVPIQRSIRRRRPRRPGPAAPRAAPPPAAEPGLPGRTPQAQKLLDVAHVERAGGRIASAVQWLKAALRLAPSDGEIAGELDALAGSEPPPGDGPAKG